MVPPPGIPDFAVWRGFARPQICKRDKPALDKTMMHDVGEYPVLTERRTEGGAEKQGAAIARLAALAVAAGLLLAPGTAGAGEFYLRGGIGLDRPDEAAFMDEDCSTASPAALYGCGTGADGAPYRSVGKFGAVPLVELGIGYGTGAIRLEALVEYRPEIRFKGRTNFLAPKRWQDVKRVTRRGAARLLRRFGPTEWPAYPLRTRSVTRSSSRDLISVRGGCAVVFGGGTRRWRRHGSMTYRKDDGYCCWAIALERLRRTMITNGRLKEPSYSLWTGASMPKQGYGRGRESRTAQRFDIPGLNDCTSTLPSTSRKTGTVPNARTS